MRNVLLRLGCGSALVFGLALASNTFAACNAESGDDLVVGIVGADGMCADGETDYTAQVTYQGSGEPYVGGGQYKWSTDSTKFDGVDGETAQTVTATAKGVTGEDVSISVHFWPENGDDTDCDAVKEVDIIKVEIDDLDCEHVGVGDTRGLSATVAPNGRTIVWSIVDPVNGCSVVSTGNLTANFTAGNENANITVTASDSVLGTCFDSIDLVLVGEFEDLDESLELRDDGEPNTYDGQWGITKVFPLELQDDWTVFFDEGNWLPDLGSIIAPYKVGVNLSGRTSLTSASQITADTYEEAIADLNAIMEGAYVGTYVPEDCIMTHELVHVDEWEELVNDGFSDLLSDVEAVSVAFVCEDRCTVDEAKLDIEEQIEAIIDDYAVEWADVWKALPEDDAEQAGFDCINNLIDAIEQQAINEGW